MMRTCDRCGAWLDSISRASDGTEVIVDAVPSPRGSWMCLTTGEDRGKYIKLSGPALHNARGENVLLYVAHSEVCNA